MDTITSRSNPLITETAKLKDKKYREEKRAFLFEGIKLTREAISSGVVIENIFMTEKCSKRYPDIANMKQTVLISDSVCMKLSENSSPEGIICRAKYMDGLHFNANENTDDISPCLFLSSLQDPGNLGTIIRTSSAFGKKIIVLDSIIF